MDQKLAKPHEADYKSPNEEKLLSLATNQLNPQEGVTFKKALCDRKFTKATFIGIGLAVVI